MRRAQLAVKLMKQEPGWFVRRGVGAVQIMEERKHIMCWGRGDVLVVCHGAGGAVGGGKIVEASWRRRRRDRCPAPSPGPATPRPK